MINRPSMHQNKRLATGLKWALGGLIFWKLLRPETRAEIRQLLGDLGQEVADYQRLQKQREMQKKLEEFLNNLFPEPKPSISASMPVPPETTPGTALISYAISHSGTLPVRPIEPDAAWRIKIVHPSVVLILGKRGSGKSALGYRLLELLRYVADIYVVGVPEKARSLLPDWIGIVPSLEDLPAKCIALVDEAHLSYNARDSMTAKNKSVSRALNLSRQKEQTIIFISLEAGHIDKNIIGSANVLVFKELGMLQLEFDRPQLTRLATQAKQALDSVRGKKQRWSFVYAPDADFLGLMENELPSFWKPSLSRLFASSPASPIKRSPRSMTPRDRQRQALELRAQGASYGEIARELGVSRGTVVNYLKGYPYR